MSYVNTRLNLQLPRAPQVSDSDVYKELQALYNSLQVFHAQVAQALGLAGLTAIQLSELGVPFGARLGEMNIISAEVHTTPVAAGDLVNIFDLTGAKVRPASKLAAARKPAHGIALDSSLTGMPKIRVCLWGHLLPGTYTPGTVYYLGDSGDFITIPTKVAGEISQKVGIAISESLMLVTPAQPFRVYAHNPQSTSTSLLLYDELGGQVFGYGLVGGSPQYYEPVLLPL